MTYSAPNKQRGEKMGKLENQSDIIAAKDFSYTMEVNGCTLLKSIIPAPLCESMREDIFEHYEKTRKLQIKAGLGETAQWGAHHICGKRNSIHDFLEAEYLHGYLTEFFDGKPYILNTIGASINAPVAMGTYEHGHKWHRDIRSYVGPGHRQMIIILVMLDEFTAENGATEVLLGTHKARDFPPESFIQAHAKPVYGTQGSIILYDADVFHRAGVNHTQKLRVGLTCAFTKPYYKQQLDYPRFLDKDYADSLTPRMRQLFGFNARVPASMEEWYCPQGRFYKSDQE